MHAVKAFLDTNMVSLTTKELTVWRANIFLSPLDLVHILSSSIS